ncbi:MAG: sugar ABC transporter ATP-binding protein [Gammaproteobacteria bacterium RIFCSPHIGHO2_12_FULL_41_20]|nr:MAG: sugar ABC transporter ATP-binding protein [Gammaproteobacteria bacterium RIFCSPHIGHO2_12_FULL_41_20]
MARVDLSSVHVEFPIYNVRSRSIKNKFLKMASGGRVIKDANQHIVVSALNNISISFLHGDHIGLIGHNGSGKSTLLRLLSRIYEPTHGQIHIDGSVSAMLDIVQGVEAEFTGYENIYIRGTLAGLTRKQIKAQIEEICELTGLGDYLAMPVRTYSSGMKVRLAFAISACINPDILLIDEVFGAGDAEFMEKARRKMITLLQQSSIVIMASHSDELIREFCNKVLLLESGQIKYFGNAEKALEMYHLSRVY